MTRKEKLYIEAVAAKLEEDIQLHISSVVKSKGYDNENSIAKYLVQGNPFCEECIAISLWIGEVWTTAYAIQSEVLAGSRSMPDDIISELPVL